MADAGTPMPSSAAPDELLVPVGEEENAREKGDPMNELE
jgi:hypothetical protein